MEGWLSAFAAAGLVRWAPDGEEALRRLDEDPDLLREDEEPDLPAEDEEEDRLREEDDRRREVERWSEGISVRTTSLVSVAICFSRNLAMRSSSRRMARASLAVSSSPTASASVSIAV
jgi:hypothetical protein